MQFFCFTKKKTFEKSHFLCNVQVLEYFPPKTFLNIQETVRLLTLVHEHTLTHTTHNQISQLCGQKLPIHEHYMDCKQNYLRWQGFHFCTVEGCLENKK